ncbi:MAG TPA: type I secretion C-terminal target domain-containing protein, partial [Burkholderiales bacterium]|nr:type I secretion C-terminal target domain-containing protein [Burkholderiales bacterium]
DRFVDLAAGDGVDTITDFAAGAAGDKLEIKDVLKGYDPATSDINSFVNLRASGADAVVSVNADGIGTDFTILAVLQGQAGLLLNDLLANGNLVVS